MHRSDGVFGTSWHDRQYVRLSAESHAAFVPAAKGLAQPEQVSGRRRDRTFMTGMMADIPGRCSHSRP